MRVLPVLGLLAGLTACIEYLPAKDGGADASGMFPMPEIADFNRDSESIRKFASTTTVSPA